MILSEDRQAHLALIITDGIWEDDIVDYNDDDAALRVAKRAIAQWMSEEDDLDQTVRTKVGSLQRTVLEGSPEWDIMYGKYYEEEVRKRGYQK